MVGDVVDVGLRCFVVCEEDVDVHEWSLAVLEGDLVDCAAADVLEDLQVRDYVRDVAEEDAAGLVIWLTAFTATTTTTTTAIIIVAVRGSNIRVVGFGKSRNVSGPWVVAFRKLKY